MSVIYWDPWKLHINHTRSDNRTYEKLIEYHIQAYHKIILSDCVIGVRSFPLIESAIKLSSSILTELHLLGCDWNYTFFSYICAVAAECCMLTSLCITGTRSELGVFTAINLDRVIHNNKNTLLEVSLNFKSSRIIATVLPTLHTCTQLACLCIFWDTLNGIEIVRSLYTWAKYNTTLRIFHTSKDTPPEIIADCFEINRTICDSLPEARHGILNKLCNDYVSASKAEDVRQSVPANLQGMEEIQNFLEDLYYKPTVAWNVLKVVVLGHGEVGKSTLIRALKEYKPPLLFQKLLSRRFTKGTIQTIGIDISTMKLGSGEAIVWDFGGQLEYSVTHQFVLSSAMVIYILCYDLSADSYTQISYWLNFLHSTLNCSQLTHSKWKVIIVGTKSDLCKETNLTFNPVPAWQAQWPDLPLHNLQFVLSCKNMNGIQKFHKSLVKICNEILHNHSTFLPKYYRTLHNTIQALPKDQCVMALSDLHSKCARYLQPQEFTNAVTYLHAVGLLVLLPGSLVCTVPSVIPQIAAKFISPLEVRRTLLSADPVTILSPHQIEVVLAQDSNKRVQNELILMEHIGVCFKLESDSTQNPSYLFPSLASHSDKFLFTTDDGSALEYAGMRVIAPAGKIFTSGFFCQLVVKLFSGFKITLRDLIAVHSNGIVFVCREAFMGQLIVKMEEKLNTVVFLMAALNPNIDCAVSLFDELVTQQIPHYGVIEKQLLCPTCTQKFVDDTPKIGTIVASTNTQVCNPLMHKITMCSKAPRRIASFQQGEAQAENQNDGEPSTKEIITSSFLPKLETDSNLQAFECRNLDLPKDLLIKDSIHFDEAKCFASGSYGEVWKGHWRGVFVAVKKLTVNIASAHKIAMLESEIKIAAKLRHPFVVQLLGVCTPINTELWLVMEYADGGSLHSQLSDSQKEIPWNTRWKWAEQAAIAVHALHSEHIVHRDIKSPNFLLVNGNLKITDFGMSTVKTVSATSSNYNEDETIGTVRWLAPECSTTKPVFNEKSDVFSLGMVLWEIASRQIPFEDVPYNAQVINLVRNGDRPEIPENCPEELADIIRQCWEHSPEVRPTSLQVSNLLHKAQNQEI